MSTEVLTLVAALGGVVVGGGLDWARMWWQAKRDERRDRVSEQKLQALRIRGLLEDQLRFGYSILGRVQTNEMKELRVEDTANLSLRRKKTLARLGDYPELRPPFTAYWNSLRTLITVGQQRELELDRDPSGEDQWRRKLQKEFDEFSNVENHLIEVMERVLPWD